MNSEEKLEQSTIVKERGTVYFKVSRHRGPEDTPQDSTGSTYSLHPAYGSWLVLPVVVCRGGRPPSRPRVPDSYRG